MSPLTSRWGCWRGKKCFEWFVSECMPRQPPRNQDVIAGIVLLEGRHTVNLTVKISNLSLSPFMQTCEVTQWAGHSSTILNQWPLSPGLWDVLMVSTGPFGNLTAPLCQQWISPQQKLPHSHMNTIRLPQGQCMHISKWSWKKRRQMLTDEDSCTDFFKLTACIYLKTLKLRILLFNF